MSRSAAVGLHRPRTPRGLFSKNPPGQTLRLFSSPSPDGSSGRCGKIKGQGAEDHTHTKSHTHTHTHTMADVEKMSAAVSHLPFPLSKLSYQRHAAQFMSLALRQANGSDLQQVEPVDDVLRVLTRKQDAVFCQANLTLLPRIFVVKLLHQASFQPINCRREGLQKRWP